MSIVLGNSIQDPFFIGPLFFPSPTDGEMCKRIKWIPRGRKKEMEIKKREKIGVLVIGRWQRMVRRDPVP
jgi:hypothetical protein